MAGNFAVDFQSVGDTTIIEFDGKSQKTIVLPGSKKKAEGGYDKKAETKAQEARREFIEGLKTGDQLFFESGGGGDRFALACFRQGATVFRLPTYIIKEERGKSKKTKQAATGNLLVQFAQEQPDRFYQFTEGDENVVEVKLLARAYHCIQNKLRKPFAQKLEAATRDLYLVRPIGQVDVEVKVVEDLVRRLFIPKETAVGKKLEELVVAIFEEVEESYQRMIERVLRRIPATKGVFNHILGCGPIIQGAVTGEMKDVRFYPAEGHLKAYAGYKNMVDGERQRRVSGETANWNHYLKQGVWGFTSQVRFWGRPHWAFRKLFDLRAPYEAEKLTWELAIAFDQLKSQSNGVSDKEIIQRERYFILSDNYTYNPKKDSDFDKDVKAALCKVRFRPLVDLKGSNGREAAAHLSLSRDLVADTMEARVKERTQRFIGQKFLEHIWRRLRVFNAGGKYQEPDWMKPEWQPPNWLKEVSR